jgi:DNA-directed RNA polymerase subunit RPC12/RpoP
MRSLSGYFRNPDPAVHVYSERVMSHRCAECGTTYEIPLTKEAGDWFWYGHAECPECGMIVTMKASYAEPDRRD